MANNTVLADRIKNISDEVNYCDSNLVEDGNNAHNINDTTMKDFERITFDPEIMGGKACIRGLRMTVSAIIGLLASGYGEKQILEMYPYLQKEDIEAALRYAAWRTCEMDVPV